jgi:FAD/FMN-containing dehydrogenase
VTTISARQGGPSRQVSPEAVAALREVFRGELVGTGDPGYEDARRVWNGNIDRRPALVARCHGVADVQRAVSFARAQGLLVSVRGGGHSAPGYGTNDDGLVIDLSAMKGIRVDPEARTAQAEGGVLWRELDRETQAVGLATTGGTVSNTGIGGLTLGGGLGWLMGKHGLTVDNLISADVVTADAELHTVSTEREPDLFWALRGGCGNFGVVTSFEFRLHPVGQILGGLVVYPLDQAADVARFYRDLCPALPDEAEAYMAFITEPQAGVPVVAMILGYNGPIDEGEKVLAPARQFGQPVADLVGPMPYAVRQTLLDEPNARNGLHRYWRSAFAGHLSDQFIDIAVEAASSFTSPLSAMVFFYMHGAAARVPAADTAFSARHAQWDIDLVGQWDNPAESDRHIGWVRTTWDKMTPLMDDRAYINHIAADDPADKVRASYGANHGRLRQLKAQYDPTNLFRMNPNITPA